MAEDSYIAEWKLERLKKIGALASSRFETVLNSYSVAIRAIREKLPGVFVECGVACGSQIAAMGFACVVEGVGRELWLYDSFEGIPMAGPNDAEQPGVGKITHDVNMPLQERLKPIGPGQGRSVEYVMRNFVKWGIPLVNCRFIKGWFQDTLLKTVPEKIAILRLDGDLYESTKVCLEKLCHLVVPGGYVIIDDYALPGCAKAVHEYLGKEKFQYNHVPTTEKVIWWRK